MLEVHAILHRQRCYENMTEKTGTLSDAYHETVEDAAVIYSLMGCRKAFGVDFKEWMNYFLNHV